VVCRFCHKENGTSDVVGGGGTKVCCFLPEILSDVACFRASADDALGHVQRKGANNTKLAVKIKNLKLR
jgi:hypothetical protein